MRIFPAGASRLARFVMIGALICAAASAVLTLSWVASDLLIHYWPQATGRFARFLALNNSVYVSILLPLFLVVFFSLLIWLYRLSLTLPQSGTPGVSPGLAVLWFFVPLCNLWQPYKVMRFTCRSLRFGEQRTPVSLYVWGVGFAAVNVLSLPFFLDTVLSYASARLHGAVYFWSVLFDSWKRALPAEVFPNAFCHLSAIWLASFLFSLGTMLTVRTVERLRVERMFPLRERQFSGAAL